MPPEFYLPNADDVKILQDLIRREAARRLNASISSENLDLWYPSEVFVAYTPLGGIPVMEVVDGEFVPGQALCRIYRILRGSSEAELKRVYAFNELVYNISCAVAIPASVFIVIMKTKWGEWVGFCPGGDSCATCGETGTGTGTGTESETGTGTGTCETLGDSFDIHDVPEVTTPSLNDWVLLVGADGCVSKISAENFSDWVCNRCDETGTGTGSDETGTG